MRTDMLTDEEKQEIIKYGQERIKVMGLFWLYIVFIAFVLDCFWKDCCFGYPFVLCGVMQAASTQIHNGSVILFRLVLLFVFSYF